MAYSSSQIPSAYEPPDSSYYDSNASYIPPSSDIYGGKRSILSAHIDPSTRPTTYDQLIDYLDMLAVQVIDPADLSIGKSIGVGAYVLCPRGNLEQPYCSFSPGCGQNASRERTQRQIHPQLRHPGGPRRDSSNVKSGEERLLPRLIVDRAVGSLWITATEVIQQWCLEVAAGLEALHQIEIIHADVKADNVLIFYDAKNWDVQTVPQLYARVSDFGFCVPDTSSRAAYAASRGTVRFRAPEALAEAPPPLRQYANQPERDVYSYGVLVWEIFNNGNIPFLGTEDGAAKHLIATFRGKSVDLMTGPLGAINGAVQRDPQRRSKWQEIFDVICASSDIRCLSPDPNHSFADYFTQSWCRQREMSWNIFQAQGLWLPTIPIPSTSSADDGTYSNIVLRELENSIQSRPSDWITMSLLRRFVERDVVELGEYGSPLLFLAVRVNAVDVMRALLVKGVDVHAADIIEDQTPLHVVRSAEAARALIEFGANVNALKRATPLHTCIAADIAEVLLYILLDLPTLSGFSSSTVQIPLSKDRFGDTALHRTLSDEVAQCLMETCPELVHAKGLLDGTPLHRRVADWSAETIRMAIRLGADVDAPNSDGETALLRSHEFTGILSDVEVMRTLFEAGAKVPLPKDNSLSSTLLHETVSPPLMEYLLEHGFQPYVNIRLKTNEQTPLHVVAAR
ncbi:kinase-like domain-containing protein [Armillaria mellea]|nr:kinase-like domain-containing protein [Armillaria mellea]